MKKLNLLLLVIIALGCSKKDDPKPEVTFSINISGFNITTDDFGSLKSTQADIFSDFDHKFSGGELIFRAPSGAIYNFNTNGISIDGFKITLPLGTYQLSGNGGSPSYGGGPKMAFSIPSQGIVIGASTISIDVTIAPECALILVADQLNLLEEAYIAPVPSPPSYPFFQDGIYLYTYFEPRSQFWANIIKKDATKLTMDTGNLKKGYVYKIEVTDGEAGMGIDLNPEFVDAEIVVW